MNKIDSRSPAQGCVIWMHGLGADASDMEGVAVYPQLAALPLRHVFLDAPVRPVTLNGGMAMRAWYDILGLKLADREDHAGITQSAAIIKKAIESQLADGFQSDQIFLAGFSQGGAMALYTALTLDKPLAGVLALSAYLPLAGDCSPVQAKNTPFFSASGVYDPVVLPDWTKKSEQWLESHGYSNITTRQYPMEHNICINEMNDIAEWLKTKIRGVNAE
ncbi:alpha/beta hydrolase [Legionella dresdenensis]|uniref:Alpha/beta hydrolase n=1 Tax=Legionella dresdenensis TaxID=450200 RepID=A0ABV8CFA5_9GAMM